MTMRGWQTQLVQEQRRPVSSRRHASWLAAATGLSAMLFAATAGADEDSPSRCEDVSFSVSIDGPAPGPYRIVGELCRPKQEKHGVLQILIHGASYNHLYWDFPFMPEQYSYVRHANAAGFATLAIDRLGAGASDHPRGDLVTVHASASTVHQIVTSLRAGDVRDARGRRIEFDRIVLVGHSFGSNISWTEAGTYGDVDGVVLTAISHLTNPPAAPLTVTDAYPAQLDPLFANAGLPDGYITTRPGTRADLFYYVPNADPQVIAVDEATKDVVPVGMLFDQFTTYGLTQNIHVPVLNVDGNFDTLSCNLPSCTATGSLDGEASDYPPDAHYRLVIVPDAGHSINLQRNAPFWFGIAQDWVEDIFEHGRR
jgi:pimeloyl-ACP methyl ester carboxylesterase